MSKVLFLVNHDVVIYNFRLELVECLLEDGHQVIISCPYGEKIDKLKEIGAIHYDIEIDRHGTNPIKDLKLIRIYKKLLKKEKPDIVFSYTIKPNIYGAIACKQIGIPCVANITGLGTAVEYPGIKQKIAILLYKYAFNNIRKVFFQNKENEKFFQENKIALGKHDILPGSGVNLERFPLQDYPDDETIKFVFVGRIMKEKGIDYFLSSADYISSKNYHAEFHVCGFLEKEYEGKLKEYVNSGKVIYHGMVSDMKEIYKNMHCVVFPSYYPEGLSNVLLEAAASGRPVITTDRAGCREAVDNGKSGIIVPIKDQNSLDKSLEYFLHINYIDKKNMGIAGRKKIEKDFDRQIVVQKYLNELHSLDL